MIWYLVIEPLRRFNTARRSTLTNDRHVLSAGGAVKIPIQRSQRQALPTGQLELGGIVYRQPVRSRKAEDFGLHRNAIHPDRNAVEAPKKTPGAGFGNSLPALVDHQDVTDLKPPQAGHDGFFRLHSPQCQIGLRMVLVFKCPTGGNRCIQHEGHQYLRPSSRAERSSSNVILPLPLRRVMILSMALSISSCRRLTSGTILAIARP